MAEVTREIEIARRIVEATEQICGLPAIGTQDWCDRAAAALARMFPGDLVGLAIIDLDAGDTVARLEAHGAGGVNPRGDALDIVRRRYEASGAVGWSLGDPGSWSGGVACARVAEASPRTWAGSDAAKHWLALGVTEVLAAAATFTPDRRRRLLIAEVGRAEMTRMFESVDAAALSATMLALARRVNLAFGSESISSSRMLTPREQEVLEHLALGRSVKEIAGRLGRSPHTVHDYVKALHRKLQATSRGALIAKALGHTAESTIEIKPQGRRSAKIG